MIGFEEALARLGSNVSCLPEETIPLGEAAGRYLAAPLFARADAPRSDVSAMDGYAVDSRALAPGRTFRVIGEATPGSPFPGHVEGDRACRIFTGAPLPAGADRVIVQENADRDGEDVRFEVDPAAGHHVRLQGSDFRTGDVLIDAGSRLHYRRMVAAAAADIPVVRVRARPRVAIIATGNELVDPGEAHLQAHAIPESASFGVAAMAEDMGAQVVGRFRGRDDIEQLGAIAEEVLSIADCIVVTGGASVGDHDLARPMFRGHDLSLVFSKVSIKPGKPVWFGSVKSTPVLGLPGNPTSAMVTARLFMKPLLALMQGGDIGAELRFSPQVLATPLPANGSRECFVRAAATADGLRAVSNQESGSQAPLGVADWLIRRPPDCEAVDAGGIVPSIPF